MSRHATREEALSEHLNNCAYASKARSSTSKIEAEFAAILHEMYRMPHVLFKARDGYEIASRAFASRFTTYKILEDVANPYSSQPQS